MQLLLLKYFTIFVFLSLLGIHKYHSSFPGVKLNSILHFFRIVKAIKCGEGRHIINNTHELLKNTPMYFIQQGPRRFTL